MIFNLLRKINVNINDLYLAFKWYYFVHIIGIKNKIKSISLFQSFLFISSLLIGGIVIYRIFLVNVKPFTQESTQIRSELFWFICIYICLQLLLKNVISINRESLYLLVVSKKKLNIHFIYSYINSCFKFYFPVLIGIIYSIIEEKYYSFFYAFFTILFFNWIVLTFVNYIQIRSLSITRMKKFVLYTLISLMLFLSFYGYIKEWNCPIVIQNIFQPLLKIFTTVSYKYKIFDSLFYYSYLVWGSFLLLFLILFLRELGNNVFELSLENNDTNIGNRKYRLFTNKKNKLGFIRISQILTNEIVILKTRILNLRGIWSLLLPNIAYIVMTIYAIYTDHEEQNYSNVMMVSLLPVLTILVFPFIHTIPILRKEIQYLWIYKMRNESMSKFIVFKLLSTFSFCLIALFVSTILIIFSLKMIFNINYFLFTDFSVVLLICFASSILPCAFAFYLSIFLPKVYFIPGLDKLHVIPTFVFACFGFLLSIPSIICIRIGSYENKLFLLILILLSIISFFFAYKVLLMLLKQKEL